MSIDPWARHSQIDYRSFGGKRSQFTNFGDSNFRWWEFKGIEQAGAVNSTLGRLKDQDEGRQTRALRCARLYGNLPLLGIATAGRDYMGESGMAMSDRLTYNGIQSAIDTIVSRITKSKPKPYYLTNGGDYHLRRKAKKLSQFSDGIFYENNAYVQGQTAFRDAAVFGDGVIHVYPKPSKNGRRVAWRRVLATELFVDDSEAGTDRMPRQMHWQRLEDRGEMIAMFPKKKNVILGANNESHLASFRYGQSVADMVLVTSSWHLRSGPDANDGQYTVSIGDDIIESKAWEHDYFPFAIIRWCPRLTGFWSQGVAEQLFPTQMELNRVLAAKQKAYHLSAKSVILMSNQSKILKEAFNNEGNTIITYQGTQVPQYVTPPVLPAEFYTEEDKLKADLYSLSGASMLAAASQKPAGLNSGKAIRAYDDVQSDRFMVPGQAYEQFYLDLAKLSIVTMQDIVKEDGLNGYEVRSRNRRWLETIDWSDIDLTEDQWIMQCFPISSLPSDPAGRLQTVQEYAQAGMFTTREAQRLLDFPDIEQVDSLMNAGEEYLTKCFDSLVDNGDMFVLDNYDNLALAFELGLEYYQIAKTHELESDRLELLRRVIERAKYLVTLNAPAPAVGAPAPGPGAPNGSSQSQLAATAQQGAPAPMAA